MIAYISPISVIDIIGPFTSDRTYVISNFEHSFELVFVKMRSSINAKIEIYQGSVVCAEVTPKSDTIHQDNATFGYKCPIKIKVISGTVSKINLFVRTINATARSIEVSAVALDS